MDVKARECAANDDCAKRPSSGVEGSSKVEYCPHHARVGMVNVTHRKCTNDCAKQPCFGLEGSRKAEHYAQHAKAGMIDVVKRAATRVALKKSQTVSQESERRHSARNIPGRR